MEQMKFCHSCAAPLASPEFKGPSENFCKYCTDEQGKVKSREEIKGGIAQWFKTWQPDVDDATASSRAENYMKSMPHWAE